jgi:hypothetical protein
MYPHERPSAERNYNSQYITIPAEKNRLITSNALLSKAIGRRLKIEKGLYILYT